MNERIKELAVKARLSYIMVKGNPNIEEDLTKFAELIIKECIHLCEKDIVPDEDVIEGYNEDWNMALKHSADQIKLHFGVDE